MTNRPAQVCCAVVACVFWSLGGAQAQSVLRLEEGRLQFEDELGEQQLRVAIDLNGRSVVASLGAEAVSGALGKGEGHVLQAELKLAGSDPAGSRQLHRVVSLIGHRLLKRPVLLEGRLDKIEEGAVGLWGPVLRADQYDAMLQLGSGSQRELLGALGTLRGARVRLAGWVNVAVDKEVWPRGARRKVPLYSVWETRRLAEVQPLAQETFLSEEVSELSGMIRAGQLLTAEGEAVTLLGPSADWLREHQQKARLTVKGVELQGLTLEEGGRLFVVRYIRARVTKFSRLEPSISFEWPEFIFPTDEVWVTRERFYKVLSVAMQDPGFLYLACDGDDGWIRVENLEFLEPEPVQPREERAGLTDLFSRE